MKKFLFLISCFLFAILNAFSQTTDTIEMADTLRSNGKIFVVVGVIAIVFTGIIIYLIHIDRKVSKLERKSKERVNYKIQE